MALSAILFFTLTLWGSHRVGWCEFPDGLLYDFFVHISPQQEKSTEELIIISVKDCSLYSKGDEVWLELLNVLTAMQPRAVVYSFLPQYVSRTFYAGASKADNVFFARQYKKKKEGGLLEPLPVQAEGLKLRTGLLASPPKSYGVYRRYATGYSTAEGHIPSLAQAVFTQTAHERTEQKQSESFFINFFQCSPIMPSLSYEQLVSGTVPIDLVRDKIVLIDFSLSLYFHGLETQRERKIY
ncbi:MAG: CHASE2 domain-containing protein, partial [Candidatus Electrothrix sp. ATG1]|nr:CHASE2 domain-containing protein [Candidatus Electrothrix sp. ATG1]